MRLIKSFQGLRVIAMLFIFFFHFKIYGQGVEVNIYNKLFSDGYFAVTFFFVLSGFLTFISLKNDKFSLNIRESFKYMLNKIKKLYPLYAIMIVIVFIINVTPEKILKWVILSIPSFMLIQSFIPTSIVYFSFNGVGWYISVLAFSYLLSYTFMSKINNKNILRNIFIIYVFQVICVFLGRNSSINQWMFYINPLFRSLDFFQGMLLAAFINEHKDIKLKDLSFIEITLVIIFTIQYLFLSKYVPQAFKWGVYYLPIILSIMAVFYYEKGIVSKFLGNKLFLKISKFSFEFYMVHQFVISQCRIYLKVNEKILLIATFIITIAISNIIKKISIMISNNKRKYNFRSVDGISIRGK